MLTYRLGAFASLENVATDMFCSLGQFLVFSVGISANEGADTYLFVACSLEGSTSFTNPMDRGDPTSINTIQE